MNQKMKDYEFIKFAVAAKVKEYHEVIGMYSEEIKKHKGNESAYTYRELRLCYKKHLRTAEKVLRRLPQFILPQ